jgi:hypothetical protein
MNLLIPAILTALVQASAAAAPAGCIVPGNALHWQADYCLLASETDDIVAAGPCLARESRISFHNTCKEKLHYKRQMCERAVKSRSRPGSVDACVKDPTFMGATVRNGGA